MGLSCLPILLTITASHMFYCQSLSFTVPFTLPFTAHLGVYTCSFYFFIVSDICVCFYHVYVSVRFRRTCDGSLALYFTSIM